MTINFPLKLHHLPNSLPLEGAVRIELVEGVPIFHASTIVQERIETLINKQKDSALTFEEEKELSVYEELDDYLSLVNRTMRNILLNPIGKKVYRYDDPFESAVPMENWEVLQ
ncbi:hypothetical protein SAMD00079811_52970 [Scytonema sp. HK-05]|uniref:hypothetical protein n=1 Tax=Scytonema sp. HK-05 TaxID=1137095 RepID=UPI000A67EC7D|nr:hypothetical protein SAMD00079811_52970 [Scytonema sp. HK-05]